MPDKQINFCLGVHNHQPVGNPPEIFERIYRRAYLPFVEILAEYPTVKATIHYCGILLAWFEESHPEFLELLKDLVERGQIELRTGGFYEPILPIIPAGDAVGQIRKLTEFLESRLSCSPKGLWLAERVWEPHLPVLLNEAGIEYIVVDDFHFLSAGFEEEQLKGYFITEAENRLLKVFPASMKLRYLIPFEPVEKTLAYLDEKLKSGSRVITLDDDGEKFGAWPKTHEAVYEQGWLRKFFRSLEANSDWVRTSTFSECLTGTKPAGRIYLPTASYPEMLEWSLPAKSAEVYEDILAELKASGAYGRYQPFFKGGFFRNFFVKYPESNRMHKKMWHVADKVHRSGNKEALDELWKGQCNDAYWHGVFGGLYLPHLRTAIYEKLIKAEALADENLPEELRHSLETTDFDKDGLNEVLLSNSLTNFYLSPARGGAIFEIDYKPKFNNLLNVLTRREEAYHQKIKEAVVEKDVKTIHEMVTAKEAGLEKYLIYDSYEKLSLIDHFFGINEDLKGFADGLCREMGDFHLSSYDILDSNEPVPGPGPTIQLGCTREIKGEKNVPLLVKKRVSLAPSGAIIHYEIRNLSQEALEILFSTEFNFSMFVEEKRFSRTAADSVELLDWVNGFTVTFQFDGGPSVESFPIETVSLSDEGFERICQGLMFLPTWRLMLDGEGIFETKLSLKIEEQP